jgi:NAD(P)-dependent dehydrogenase (short-subunit alcohol dehydrogenase family)
MHPAPEYVPRFKGSGRLEDRIALITGGDSGIGRAVAIAMAREGADIAFVYLEEQRDADDTVQLIEAENKQALAIKGDIGDEAFCQDVVRRTVDTFGKLDILVNNAAEQHLRNRLEDISAEQLERTFRSNVFGYFYMTKAALPHLREGSSIINTTSITAYKGSAHLMDYSATRGAIVSFTRSLSQAVVDRGIRVNGVAPGPIWTPLVNSSYPAEGIESFGKNTPMGRAGQPREVAPCYVFLASEHSSYMTGQVLHPNGGTVVGG